MSTITFDTLEYAKKLKRVGFTEEQAEAQAEAQKEMLAEVLDATLASKDDIHHLKNDINNLRTGVKDDINRLEKQIIVLKWMTVVMIAGVISLVMKAFFIP